jgi:hypothetical protein
MSVRAAQHRDLTDKPHGGWNLISELDAKDSVFGGSEGALDASCPK